MLPFTKRPGRGEDADVVTKDDLVKPTPPPASRRRPPLDSISEEDEQTHLMPTKSLGNAVAASVSRGAINAVTGPRVRPAAGTPAPRSSARLDVPPSSRGPKIVKRTNGGASKSSLQVPTAVNPSAVIKQTVEAARAKGLGQPRSGLLAGPPAELLEEDLFDTPRGSVRADGPGETLLMPPSRPSTPPYGQQLNAQLAQVVASNQVLASQPLGSQPLGSQPLGSQMANGPISVRPGSSQPPVGFAGPPSASVPGMSVSSSVPAHFMMAQAPYSEARIDPPGTAITARHKVGRPAASWAVALLAFGLFVGVGAVAAMQGGGSVLDTTASFVDPSHAAHAAGNQPVAANAMQTAEAPKVAVPAETAAVPVLAVNAQPVPVPVAVTNVVQPAQPVAAEPRTPTPVAATPKAEPAPVAAKAAPRPVVAWNPPPRPVAAPKPSPPAEEEAPKPTAKAAPKKGGKAGGGEADEETKKALEALQKAQLESSSSFGEK